MMQNDSERHTYTTEKRMVLDVSIFSLYFAFEKNDNITFRMFQVGQTLNISSKQPRTFKFLERDGGRGTGLV